MSKDKKGGFCMTIILTYLFGVVSGMFILAFAIVSSNADDKLEEMNMKAGEQDGKEQQADKPIQSNVQADSEHHA